MKNYLPLHTIALLLLTTFVFIGCSAKETAPPDTADIPLTQEPVETEASLSPEAEMTEKPQAPEADADDETLSPEAEMTEKPQAPEQETKPETAMPTVEMPSDSVLHLIPASTLGVIYCPSLTELDNRINMLAADLLPTAEPPEVLAGILADAFGAGFESLAELEEIGLDMNQDFAIFMTSLKPPDLSATVHLTNPDAMKQVIDAESEGTAPIEYKGVTYWNAAGGGGSFAIIDNILVFTRTPEVCESVIDTYTGTQQAVTSNPEYRAFLADIAEATSQLAVYFDFEPIVSDLNARLESGLEGLRDNLESDPTTMAAAPFLEGMTKTAIEILNQVKSLNAALEIEGTDVQLTQFFEIKSGGNLQDLLTQMKPHPLALLDDFSSQVFMKGGFQIKPELLNEMNMFWIEMFSQNFTPEQAASFEELVKRVEHVYKSFGDEWVFTANYTNSLLPDYLLVCEVKDEQPVRTYLEEMLLEQLRQSTQIMRDVTGNMPQLNMYDGAHAGTPIMHNGVEIKSLVFPNFGAALGEMPAPTSELIPKEWTWYHAFYEGQLFLAIGNLEPIKTVLDQKTQTDEVPLESPSYQKLVERLGTDNNLFFAVSPMTAVKGLLPIIARTDPDAAAPMQMLSGMLMNMPETYSIGFSAKAEESGIGAKLLLTLGEFKQLIQMIAMMQNMGQMQ